MNVLSPLLALQALAAGNAVGPEPLRGTAAALDPALWFWGKWGCSFCERAKRRVPIHERVRRVSVG
jgi:hypothetical protein